MSMQKVVTKNTVQYEGSVYGPGTHLVVDDATAKRWASLGVIETGSEVEKREASLAAAERKELDAYRRSERLLSAKLEEAEREASMLKAERDQLRTQLDSALATATAATSERDALKAQLDELGDKTKGKAKS